jgi:hypothetical protein
MRLREGGAEMNELVAMAIMVWMYAVVIGCFGYVIGRLVCECRRIMRKRREYKPHNTQFIYRDYCIGCRRDIPTESGHVCERCGGGQ